MVMASMVALRTLRMVGIAALEVVQLAQRVAQQRGHRRAPIAAELAPDQVVGLDAGGAFVDRGDAHVAQRLRHAGLLDETHAAVHLHRQRGQFRGLIGAPALDDRDQQLAARQRGGARGRVGFGARAIELQAVYSASARIASTLAFMVSSMRRTSG
jgi:hypothetical protein